MPAGSIVLLPGLGADAAMYRPQQRHFGDRVVTPAWIDPLHLDEPLEQYAARLLPTIEAMPGLVRPYHIGGVSFGGMVAGEICELAPRDCLGLLLIGSCTHRRQIRLQFRLGEMVIRLSPRGLMKGWLNKIVPEIFAFMERADPAEKALLAEMAYRSDTRLIKWQARAIRRWQTQAASRVPMFHAHGALDPVIPIHRRQMRPGLDLVVDGGHHLIGLTHAGEVNAWLGRVCGP